MKSNNEMKVIICELGSIGKRHLENLISLGFEPNNILIYRSGEGPQEFGDKVLEEHNNRYSVFNDLSAALKEKPDIAIIANPTSLHVPVALKVAKAGCHLFIEKPISHNLDDIDELLNITRENKKLIYVGYCYRQHPQLIQIKKILDNGELGEIFYSRFTTGEYLPDWHPWENYSKGYAAKKELGGGVMLTQSHDLDTAMWFFGSPISGNAILSTTGKLDLDVDDKTEINAVFENCPSASFHLDYLTRPSLKRAEIFGTDGRLEWNYTHEESSLIFYNKDGTKKNFPLPKGFERNDMYVAELEEFMGCINSGKKPPTNGESAREILSFMDSLSKN